MPGVTDRPDGHRKEGTGERHRLAASGNAAGRQDEVCRTSNPAGRPILFVVIRAVEEIYNYVEVTW